MQNCLVTGATGFIGRYLCVELQQQGYRVYTVNRKATRKNSATQRIWDMQQSIPKTLCKNIDTVFHLAGIAHRLDRHIDASEYQRINVDATQELVTLAGSVGVKNFILFSSVRALADPGSECIDDTFNLPAQDAYGASKWQAEQVILQAAQRYTMHTVVLRPSLVYGAGVKGNLLRMLTAIDNNRFPPLNNIDNQRSMIHVIDLVKSSILLAQTLSTQGCYIISDNQHYSTTEIYHALLLALGKEIPKWTVPNKLLRIIAYINDRLEIKMLPNSSTIARLFGSACYISERLYTEINYTPHYHFASAVDEMVQHYRQSC